MTEEKQEPIICPECQTDLLEVGVIEVTSNTTIWAEHYYQNGSWWTGDEEFGPSEGSWIECRHCKARLPDELEQLVSGQL